MNLRERGVTLVDDPYWPERFETIDEVLQTAIHPQPTAVYHVGSTAIPDVPGKPALDVIVIFDHESAIETAADTLVADHGFERPREGTVLIRWEEDWAVFLKLHVPGDARVAGQLAFRDYLCDHRAPRTAYAELKREAAADHRDDLEAYTKAKGEFVQSVLEDARAEGYYDDLPADI